MEMTPQEEQCFEELLRGWADSAPAQRMRAFVQHGSVSTYDHCLRVAKMAFLLNRRLHLGAEETSLVRGAFLHDFFLYDWHNCAAITRWHGFEHPGIALKNAEAFFPLNEREKNVIASHMWPLTPTAVPRCREAVVVCLADKYCSMGETVLERHTSAKQK